MAIWVEENAKLLVQGITGKQGMFHADKMVEYGTNIVGGCTPGKGGQTVELQGRTFPVWDSMFDAIKATDADATVIYVPPPFAAEAIMEAADAFDTVKGEGVVVCITEGIPTLDMVRAVAFVENRPGVRLINEVLGHEAVLPLRLLAEPGELQNEGLVLGVVVRRMDHLGDLLQGLSAC